MRALHVFPVFSNELIGGSDYYQYMLTRKLLDLGVEVEVFATCARRVRQRWAFGLDWLMEPSFVDSGWRSSLVLGISEHFEMLTKVPAFAGDFRCP